MFYHWLAPLGKTYIIFNLFNYISFRAAGATVTALLLAFLVGPPVIARLRARKVGQIIRAEGPASHQSKRGTPTMGGLIIILATIVPTLLWAPLTNRFVVVVDDDIDPADMDKVLWAMCTRFDPREGLEVLKGCWSTVLDPMVYSENDRRNSRLVIDACKPWSRRDTFPEVVRNSKGLDERIKAKFAAILPRG